MSVNTITLGSNSAEIVVTGPESYQNVAAAVQSFMTSHGWNLVPDTTPSSGSNGVTVSDGPPLNRYLCNSISGFAVGMPVYFTGTPFGNVSTGITYFIYSISGNYIQLSTISPIQNPGTATVFPLVTSSGTNLTMFSRISGLTANSTNARQRVFYAYNLSGLTHKYCRLNLYDLTIDTALSYSYGGANQGTPFYNANQPASRQCHFQHMSYPRDYYINTTISQTATVNGGTSVSYPGFTRNNASANTPVSNATNTANYSSGGASSATTVTVTGVVGAIFPGQIISGTGVPSNTYVTAYVSSTGVVTVSNAFNLQASGTYTFYNTTFGNAPTLGTSGTLSFGSGYGLPVYIGMPVALYSVSSGNYAISTVTQYQDNNSGTLWVDVPYHMTAIGSDYTDWVLLWPGTLNYNNSLNPCYIYISATARHVCIQTRNYDGVWNDWISITEYENPLGINNNISNTEATSATNYGLTTGFMSGNSGYIDWINNGLGSPDPTTTMTATTANAYAGYLSATVFTGATGFNSTANANSSSPGGTRSYNPGTYYTGRIYTSMHKGGKFVTFTGPMSTPYTYKARVNSAVPLAAQTSKLITPFGEAGYLGGLFRQIPQDTSYNIPSASTLLVQWDEVFTMFFKGMGDVMPNALNLPAGTKHIAVTPNITVDVGNTTTTGTVSTDFASFATANLLDQWTGPVVTTGTPGVGYFRQNAPAGPWGSYSNLSANSTSQPTPYGRVYGIKYVTTSLGTLNTIGIKVDASGFTSTTGSSADHIVFSYPSPYNSPDVNTVIGGKSGNALLKPTIAAAGQETVTTQQNVRNSQSVSVAFPK
jgi:hypothetical protein